MSFHIRNNTDRTYDFNRDFNPPVVAKLLPGATAEYSEAEFRKIANAVLVDMRPRFCAMGGRAAPELLVSVVEGEQETPLDPAQIASLLGLNLHTLRGWALERDAVLDALGKNYVFPDGAA